MLTANEQRGRISRLMRTEIDSFGLNLSGFTVLTEVGTNYFALTPVIAATAGADVLAIVPNDPSVADEAIGDMTHYERMMSPVGKISLFRREDVPWERADIVTNLGHVRPIDAGIVNKLSGRAVVSLMAEWWEIRDPEDVDIAALRAANVPVLATDEHKLRIWDYLGWLVLKLLHDEDIEGRKSVVGVWGADKFAVAVVNSLRNFGVCVLEWEWDATLTDWAEYVDAIILVDYFGHLEEVAVPEDVVFIPFVSNKRMLRTLAYLGPRPLIELHVAGLKVGEVLARTGLHGTEAEREAMRTCFFTQDDGGE